MHMQPEPDLTPVFYDWSLSFEHTTTRQALAYWQTCRGTRSMPTFADLEVRGMKRFVANSGLIDVLSLEGSTFDYSVKLTGEKIRERYGGIAHRKLSEFLPPNMERRWRRALDLVRVAEAPLRVHGRMSYEDHTWLYQETLLAPLSRADGAVGVFLLVTAWWPATTP